MVNLLRWCANNQRGAIILEHLCLYYMPRQIRHIFDEHWRVLSETISEIDVNLANSTVREQFAWFVREVGNALMRDIIPKRYKVDDLIHALTEYRNKHLAHRNISKDKMPSEYQGFVLVRYMMFMFNVYVVKNGLGIDLANQEKLVAGLRMVFRLKDQGDWNEPSHQRYQRW